MSQAAPIPPPPPPTTSTKIDSFRATSKVDKIAVPVIQIPNNECSWALKYPEVQKGCYLSRVCQHLEPKRCQYYAIASLLQVGPTCGLTALSMLLNGQPNAQELLSDAIVQKYTKNGEMFSVQYLFELTEKYLNGAGVCQVHEGILNCAEIREQLCAGACLLVPYPF